MTTRYTREEWFRAAMVTQRNAARDWGSTARPSRRIANAAADAAMAQRTVKAAVAAADKIIADQHPTYLITRAVIKMQRLGLGSQA